MMLGSGPSIVLLTSRFYPSKEESEYTAHLYFTLVVACSHWAVHHGFAVPKIQRLPPMQVYLGLGVSCQAPVKTTGVGDLVTWRAISPQ